MFRLKLINQTIFIVNIVVVGLSSAYAEVFRWVDDDGSIHYSDSLPPSESQREQNVLNEHGRTIETIPAPKTAGQIEEEAKLAKIEEQKRKVQEEAERKDRVLLAMFLTVEDIELVRDERIATVESAIKLTEFRKKKFINKLQALDASEQRFKAIGKELPPAIIKSRAHYQEQLLNVNKILAIKEKEKLVIKKRFAGDINRYIELKQNSPI